MKKEFIPYEQALALKELGFDEPYFGYFHGIYEKDLIIYPIKGCVNSALLKQEISTPVYQQAFRWFREKHDLDFYITNHERYCGFGGVVTKKTNKFFLHVFNGYSTFNTYEEAELACLKKLIEIVKNKK